MAYCARHHVNLSVGPFDTLCPESEHEADFVAMLEDLTPAELDEAIENFRVREASPKPYVESDPADDIPF